MQTRLGSQQAEVFLDFSSAADISIVPNADGSTNYVDMTFQGETFRQTFTYTAGGILTGISALVKQ